MNNQTTDGCPNCKEKTAPCACIRNKCNKCGNPVRNITFTACDDCWDDTVTTLPNEGDAVGKEAERKEITYTVDDLRGLLQMLLDDELRIVDKEFYLGMMPVDIDTVIGAYLIDKN